MSAKSYLKGRWFIQAPEDKTREILQLFDFETIIQNRIDLGSVADWSLIWTNLGWQLQDCEAHKLCIHFDADKMNYQRRHQGPHREILARALGYNTGIRHVIDCTAGLGQDAVFISQLGFQVTAFERHPLLFYLLDFARKNTKQESLQNLVFKAGEFLQQEDSFHAQVIYYDPMYPAKKKSALPRQEMMLFKKLVGEDADYDQVLKKLIQRSERVVVKRPKNYRHEGFQPAHSFTGQSIRYDLFLNHKGVRL